MDPSIDLIKYECILAGSQDIILTGFLFSYRAGVLAPAVAEVFID